MKSVIILTLTAIVFPSPFSFLVDGSNKGQLHSRFPPRSSPLSISENQGIQNLQPTNNKYAWDITGENPNKICRTNGRLRQLRKIAL